jgi:hypothetical protein
VQAAGRRFDRRGQEATKGPAPRNAGPSEDASMRIAIAALLYFVIVFGVGMVLGPFRVLWLEPRLGATLAVLCETPFLLAAMVIAARWVPRRLRLGNDLASLVVMGLGALVLQQAADLALGVWLRGLTPAEQLANFATPPGGIYLALLVIFAGLPAALNVAHRQKI